MVCSKSSWVDLFAAGRLDEPGVLAMEAHVDGCEECFLRIAAAAAELSGSERMSLGARSRSGSRVAICLRNATLAATLVGEPRTLLASGDASARRTIGPYLVTGWLGMGGMSVVYRAKHQVTGREVALKAVKMPLVASFLALLRQEIEFLRDSHHPGIVSVLDSDLMAADPWYAMELFQGPTLEAFNRRLWGQVAAAGPAGGGAAPHAPSTSRSPATKPRPLAAGGRLSEVLRLFARLCDPVGFIHGSGMVHGDIKPSNVFLRDDQQPVLMDFGLVSRAKGTVGREALDVTGRIRGTLPYIAPETIRGQIPDARVDLYALGCMLYESIVGVPPFVSPRGINIIDMHLGVPPQPASQRVDGVPPEVDDLLARLLAKDPRERFGHATALGTALMAMADAKSGAAVAGESPVIASEGRMPLFRPPIVGRDAELDAILQCAQGAGRSSSGGMFLVSGESGIGKTFFTSEVAQRALLAGIQVITGECVPLTPTSDMTNDAGTTPLQPLRRFFQMLRDRCRERGQSEVDRLFGPRLDLLSAYVPTLHQLRRPGESYQPPPRLPASGARERVVAAVVDTIAAHASGGSVLFALDDLQWADDLSLAVLDRLDQEFFSRVPLVVVGTYRSDEAGEAVAHLARKDWTHDLQLGRLDKREIAGLVGGMLSMASPPEPLVEYVHVHAEGVPFFAAEYLRALVADGVLVCRHGSWVSRGGGFGETPPLNEARLPMTLQDLIRGRLNRLPADVVELLEAGAVVGRRFSASLVGRIVNRPVAELVGSLSSTVAAQITESDGFDGFTFLHDKIRETLYAGLSPERRRQFHLDTARALEEDDPIPPDQYGFIGTHLRQAGESMRAIGYLEKAGDHALTMAANAEADRFLREAIELEATLSPRLPSLRRACWQRQRGDALQGLGLMMESARALKVAAALLGRPFPAGKLAFAARLAHEVVRQVWHRLRPHAIKRPRSGHRESNEEIVRVFDRMHQASFYLGNDADLVFSTTVSLNASERAGTTPTLALAYTNAAMMAGVLPLPKLADRYFRLAAAAVEQAPDLESESWLLLMEGAYRTWHGKRDRAIDCLDRAIALLRQGGFFRRCDEAESARIGIDVFAGLYIPALTGLDAVENRSRKRRDLQIQAWASLQRVEADVICGAHEAALEGIARVGTLLPSLGRPECIWSSGLEAYLRHRLGEREHAERLVAHTVELISRGPPVHSYCVTAYDRLAETAVALCRGASTERARRAAVAQARAACSILDRAVRVFPIAKPAAALHRGTLNLFLGRERPASVVGAWRAAVSTASALKLPYQELRLHAAILDHVDPAAPEMLVGRRRMAELVRFLGLNNRKTPTGWGIAEGLSGGVEVEGKSEGWFL